MCGPGGDMDAFGVAQLVPQFFCDVGRKGRKKNQNGFEDFSFAALQCT